MGFLGGNIGQMLGGGGMGAAAGAAGNMTEPVMGFDAMKRGPQVQPERPSTFSRILGGMGQGLGQMGQPQQMQMQAPQMQDPLAMLRGLGFDVTGNHLGRIGQM